MPRPKAPDPFAEMMSAVARHWGFRSLRPLQEQAMRAVLARRDSLVVLPTGGGKSLCYQAPALVRPDETTLVVSPLISLMKDQVDNLCAAGVPALHIDSTLSDDEKRDVVRRLRQGEIRLLFVSPERLVLSGFQSLLREVGVQTFAIDEAHCISHWGHDFRPEYRQLAALREQFPDAAVHAYTATATQPVREDIIRQLGLKKPEVLVGSFDRPNLTYRVLPRHKLLDQVLEVLQRHRGEAGIIYCISRKGVDELTAQLRERGWNALRYRAAHPDESPQLNAVERKATQEAFRNGTCDVVVATVAFGMGIDRSDVRFVLHTGMPKSVEHYQQEAGRAGRDGLEAECVLLHSGSDIITWKSVLEKSAERNEADAEFLPNAFRHLEEIHGYCRGVSCRHRYLVEYFGQKYDGPNCEACDLCLGEVEFETDSMTIAQKILSCVARVQERFGVGHIVSVLRGEDSEKVRKFGHQKLTTHGILSDHSAAQVRDWTYQLINQGVLAQSGDEYPVLKLNAASWQVMRKECEVRLLRTVKRERSRRSRAETVSWEGVDRGLLDELKAWRREKAEERGRPPYGVFDDRTLRELCQVRPTTPERLRLVSGIGETRLRDFGEELLSVIRRYCDRVGLDTDLELSPDDAPAAAPAKATPPQAADVAFPLFRRGAGVEEVAQKTGRAASTIMQYLCDFVRRERPASIDAWVDPDTQIRVATVARRMGPPPLRLKPVYVALGEQVPYDAIRVVLAHIEATNEAPAG